MRPGVFVIFDDLVASKPSSFQWLMHAHEKIAVDESHVQPALTAGVTIDHLFSIIVALLGGVIWSAFGFQYVFLLGAVLAVINFFTALRVNGARVAGGNAAVLQKVEGGEAKGGGERTARTRR